MMKPYFNYFRNFYPLDQSLFYVAHWWHPAAYETQMISATATRRPRWPRPSTSCTAR